MRKIERKHIGTALFGAILIVSAFVLFREHITIFGGRLVAISAKKLTVLGLFYLASIGSMIAIGGRKAFSIGALFLAAATMYSAKSDFYTLRAEDYSGNGNYYVYRNNDYLYEKDKIRAAKARSKNIQEMWRLLCARHDSFCSDSRLSDFDKLEKVIFITSSLFESGNLNPGNNDKRGCVGHSEETNFERIKVDFALYRKSSVGCCDDFARFTASFLNYLKLTNEFVEMPGHVANRVRIDGKWVFADANTALIVKGLFDKPGGAKIFYIYPHSDVDLVSNKADVLSFQREELSYFTDNVHFIMNYMSFRSSADVNDRYLR